jgi:hypothetical protein
VRDLLPEDMLEIHRGETRVKPSQRPNLPQLVFVRPDGSTGTREGGTVGHFLEYSKKMARHLRRTVK